MQLNIRGFQHLGIPVTDLKRSEAFYAQLGFKNVMQSVFQMNGEEGQVSMMQQGTMVIELYQMPEQELTAVRNRNDGHIDHIAFDVEDIEQTFESLTQGGYQIFEEQPVFLPFWKNGCKYFNIAGPDGERLEFNQIL